MADMVAIILIHGVCISYDVFINNCNHVVDSKVFVLGKMVWIWCWNTVMMAIYEYEVRIKVISFI